MALSVACGALFVLYSAQVFEWRFLRHLENLAYDLRLQLTLPWYMAVTQFSGEEISTEAPYNLVMPRSACPHCGHAIRAWENIPLVSYALQRGRCSACHEPLTEPDDVGRTWSRSLGAGCADCHVDPHAGQFSRNGASDCARCHAPEFERFLSFDHERDSRFSLGEQHRGLECSACHKPYAGEDGLDVTRYRPLGTQCVDCHGVHEDVLMRRKRRTKG